MNKDIYRDRLEKPLDKKVLQFISSIQDDLWIVQEDIIGTEAHNIMLYEQGIINEHEIKKILCSLEKIRKQFLSDKLELDEEFEDIHPFIEKMVIDDIGLDIGGKIHTGRSRNDQVSVDLRLKIRTQLNNLSEKLIELAEILLKLSKKTIDMFMPLYTHLQKGQLGSFAHYINYYLAQILRSLERIEEVYQRINKNPLGACAIGGTSININRMRTAELLGFEGIIENSIDAVSSRDYLYEILMNLSLLSLQFSRIAEDLIIWSTDEFDFVKLDDMFCSVSSVMPQKRNPDTLELVRAKCSQVISNLFTASLIIKGVPSGYFKDFQDLKPLIRISFEIVFTIIDLYQDIFATIKINRQNMIKAIEKSSILALDLAENLVQKYNIPFRISHKIVAQSVKDSNAKHNIFNKKKLETLIFEIDNQKIDLSNDFIFKLQEIDYCLDKRISRGSPSKLEVLNYISLVNKELEKFKSKYQKRMMAIKKFEKSRENIIKKLIS
jgi:argininosuccinate lyase